MRALVTGATGFVGGHLVSYLRQKGFEIWASFHKRKKKFPFRVNWVPADLTRFDQVLHLVEKSRPDYVFHLAAKARPLLSWKGPEITLRTNVSSSIFLLEGMLRFAPKARGLFVSTGQVYGSSFFEKSRLDELETASPMAPYSGSKLLMEIAALNYVKVYGLDIVIARSFNSIGPGQDAGFVFPDFCRQVARIEAGKTEPFIHVRNENIVRDFLHVEDAARAYLLLAKRGKKGNVYNVGWGSGTRLKDILNFLRKESRVPFQIKTVDPTQNKESIPCAVSNPSKLRKLGWKPQRTIWEGLSEVLAEWREKVESR